MAQLWHFHFQNLDILCHLVNHSFAFLEYVLHLRLIPLIGLENR